MISPTTLREISILRMLSRDPYVVKLMDVKQGVNKNGNNVLYLVFEYVETDLKKFIRSYRQTGENIPPKVIKSLMYQLCEGLLRSFWVPPIIRPQLTCGLLAAYLLN
ncbi:putative protein-serine/threonine kinase CMGC-CDK-Pl family [Helianthus anomalus]